MNRLVLSTLTSIVALGATNVYWWRRERTVHRGLSVSRDWEESSGIVREDVRKAAEMADTTPEELPEEVERLHGRIEDQESKLAQYSTRLGNVRTRWAELWWETVALDHIVFDEPQVLTLVVPDGEAADAEALAKRALTRERLLGIFGASGDGTFVVTVGEELRERFSAAELATELATEVNGGAGGSRRSATGGGASERLQPAIDDIEERIENCAPFG